MSIKKKNKKISNKKSFTPTYLFLSPFLPSLCFSSLSPSIWQPVHLSLFLPLSLLLSFCLPIWTHLTLCQIMLLDLVGSCLFFFSRFPPFYSSLRITSNKQKHIVSHISLRTHTVTALRACVSERERVCVDISASL